MSQGRIRTWQFQDITLELRENPTGSPVRLPKHSHREYQIILSHHMTTRYGYRGGNYLATLGSLVVLHPGEVHSAQGVQDERPMVPLRTFLVPAGHLEKVTGEARVKPSGLPFFPEPILRETSVTSLFLRVHQVLETSPMILEKDVLLLSAFTHLYTCHAAERLRLRPMGRERDAVRRAREYLEDKSAENVRLAQLADIAGLSPFYLCRVFTQEVGLPPQVYQTQVRVERAKALLIQGRSISEAALLTGFTDQSHFTRQFRRSVGVTPGRYVRHL